MLEDSSPKPPDLVAGCPIHECVDKRVEDAAEEDEGHGAGVDRRGDGDVVVAEAGRHDKERPAKKVRRADKKNRLHRFAFRATNAAHILRRQGTVVRIRRAGRPRNSVYCRRTTCGRRCCRGGGDGGGRVHFCRSLGVSQGCPEDAQIAPGLDKSRDHNDEGQENDWITAVDAPLYAADELLRIVAKRAPAQQWRQAQSKAESPGGPDDAVA